MIAITRSLNFRVIAALLMAAVMSLSPAVTLGQSSYKDQGTIHAITKTAVNMGEGFIPLSPTVKIKLENGAPGEIRNLAEGDLVELRVIRLDRKFLVDSIQLLR